MESKQASDYLFVMTKFGELSLKQKVWSRIESLHIPSNKLLTMQMQVFDSFYLGFLYLNLTFRTKVAKSANFDLSLLYKSNFS